MQTNLKHEVDPMMVSRIESPANASGTASGSGMKGQAGQAITPRGNQGATANQEPRRRTTVRYGRLTLALVGLAGLVAMPVTIVTSALSATSWVIPAIAFAVTLGAVLVLRTLARRDQARRRAAKFEAKARSASSGAATSARNEDRNEDRSEKSALTPTALNSGAKAPFDASSAEDSVRRGAGSAEALRSGKVDTRTQAAAVVTREQLRSMALEQVRVIEGNETGGATTGLKNTQASGWKPVSVPRPTYTAAPKAERAQVAPVEIPEQPKPEGKVNIAREQAAKKAAEVEAQQTDTAAAEVQAPEKTAEKAAAKRPETAPVETRRTNTGQLNLDDVLQRRRA
ncbi:hypothetical protein [Haematomicrobium sanguinis]|uniref:hypothetical protein n=1 Tax=Haematomicrobium sanguinis TaxID=479106 RepID=UPI00146FBAC7|nr:hypothetical protein [Haematomicrobium sanguinis]